MDPDTRHPPSPARGASHPPGIVSERWVWADIEQRNWEVELSPDRIRLRSDRQALELPASAWSRDIYVVQHAESYVIRIETFHLSVRFVLPRETAAPFLEHLERGRQVPRAPATEHRDSGGETPLLWPKVSPLAVWALICSTLVFVPVVGLIPAAATVVLLILHRRMVRRARAWRHSRALCTAAFLFLLAGLFVSALVTWSVAQPPTTIHPGGRIAASAAHAGRNWGIIAAGLFVVLLSLSVHEAAHAITAWWVGDGLARSLGRVTLNPMAHVDPFGTLLLPLILVMVGGPVFGYARPVPVRVESLPRHRRAHILISLAGPGSNLLLAAASLMLLLALGCLLRLAFPDAAVANLATLDFRQPVTASGFPLAAVFAPFCTILKLSFIINTFLAMFNLIPIPPLDGSWVLEHLFPSSLGRLYSAIRPYGFLVFVGAIYLGLFHYLMLPVAAFLVPGLLLLERATGM